MKIQFLDNELLCWPNGNCPMDQQKHIIQIGLVEVETNTLKITRKKSFYIRPQDKNFEVSDYCVNLTGITRSKIINEGHYFPEVMKTIKKEFAPYFKVTYSWGNDFQSIAEHCIQYECTNPWNISNFWDYGIIFRTMMNEKSKLPLKEALKTIGLEFEGRPHNAENDANALAQLHNEIARIFRNRYVYGN